MSSGANAGRRHCSFGITYCAVTSRQLLPFQKPDRPWVTAYRCAFESVVVVLSGQAMAWPGSGAQVLEQKPGDVIGGQVRHPVAGAWQFLFGVAGLDVELGCQRG